MLVELTCLVGHYGIVTAILNAFEVAPASTGEPLPLACAPGGTPSLFWVTGSADIFRHDRRVQRHND